MADDRLIERIWYGRGVVPAAARLALLPLEAVFAAAVATRGLLYDAGVLRTSESVLPSISIGNLTVGGTGKTPVAAWLAGTLAAHGARPAIVLRGYGDDEPAVHRVLNPDIPVVVSAERSAGVRAARAGGADVAVLDDAFQHRKAARVADVVLVSADRWSGAPRLLPAGPWRERPSAARRATLLVVTRKAATDEMVEAVEGVLERVAPMVPRARIRLEPKELVELEGSRRLSLDALRGASARALLSIGDPEAFIRQLRAAGARATASVFPDHHVFSDAEIRAFTATTAASDFAVCTLKDGVKIAGRWPREAPPLWYVSQHVNVERGADAFERLVKDIVRARDRLTPTAG